jgi:hypothetical protein
MITQGKWAHRTPPGVRQRHKCISLIKRPFSQLILSSVELRWVEYHVAESSPPYTSLSLSLVKAPRRENKTIFTDKSTVCTSNCFRREKYKRCTECVHRPHSDFSGLAVKRSTSQCETVCIGCFSWHSYSCRIIDYVIKNCFVLLLS